MTMPDLAEKLERAAEDARIAAGTLFVMSDPCSRDGSAAWAGLSIALFALAASHRDRAKLDDHQTGVLVGCRAAFERTEPLYTAAQVQERVEEAVAAERRAGDAQRAGAIDGALQMQARLQAQDLEQAVSEAVAKEREACAALCHDYAASCFANSMQMALRVAGDAIRARSRGGEG